MTTKFSRDELVERLVRAGEAEVAGAPRRKSPATSIRRTSAFTGLQGLSPTTRASAPTSLQSGARLRIERSGAGSSSWKATPWPARLGSKARSSTNSRCRPPGRYRPTVPASRWTSSIFSGSMIKGGSSRNSCGRTIDTFYVSWVRNTGRRAARLGRVAPQWVAHVSLRLPSVGYFCPSPRKVPKRVNYDFSRRLSLFDEPQRGHF